MIYTRKQKLIAWVLCCMTAGAALVLFMWLSLSAGQGILMPLDDAYIHFQYAHQLAQGQPYIYNPGLPPTSGATSFLYPYLLAAGSLFGFTGQFLGTWAMIIGALALALSGWLIFRLAAIQRAPYWAALAFALCFQFSGVFLWHAFSGMETLLAVLFLLWLFVALVEDRLWQAAAAASLCALIRPEGAIPALLAACLLAWHLIALDRVRDTPNIAGYANGVPYRRYLRWIAPLMPIAAIALQPAVNKLMTGSFIASGNAAKSILGIIPFDMSVIAERILDNVMRMWREIFSFSEPFVYVGPVLLVLGIFGIIALWRQRGQRPVSIFSILTLGGMTAAISTLDTAFWHFKRYQIPLVALIWALAIIGSIYLAQLVGRRFAPRYTAWLYAVIIGVLVVSVVRTANFLPAYSANVSYIAQQPFQMAVWLRENAPEDAVIAVHDVGEMRYFGERTTLDMVGLTTPGAADYWRNGPGAVGEFLDAQRPDLIASYGIGHGLGLGYLAETDLYAETLAEYRVEYDSTVNVALAAELQGIYRPNYSAADRAVSVQALPLVSPYLEGMILVDLLDAADVVSEQQHQYAWHNDEAPGGFPTEYYQFNTIGCNDNCNVMDGGRRINGSESFTLHTQAGQDLILVTRVHPAAAGRYAVYANGVFAGERVIPALPGAWLEIPTLIPAELVTDETVIRIEPLTDGNSYIPYTHWAYQGEYLPQSVSSTPLTTFQDGAIALQSAELAVEDGRLMLSLDWMRPVDAAQPTGDYKLFVHVLDGEGNIAAQADTRPGHDALPPGNWLPGLLSDSIAIDLPPSAEGVYTVVIGLYDPVTSERLTPSQSDEFGRFSLGTIELS